MPTCDRRKGLSVVQEEGPSGQCEHLKGVRVQFSREAQSETDRDFLSNLACTLLPGSSILLPFRGRGQRLGLSLVQVR